MSSDDGTKAGFTLVELLVVIGIIVLLIGLLLPAVTRAYRNGVRARMAADLQVISSGLDAYKLDFKDYPRPDPNHPLQGSQILLWALIAPGPAVTSGTLIGDGADGPGFTARVPNQGQVYGPYIPPDRFKYSVDTTKKVPINGQDRLQDRYGHPIIYLVANTGADIHNTPPAGGGYLAQWTYPTGNNTPPPMFNANDGLVDFASTTNYNGVQTQAFLDMKTALGDKNTNSKIDGAETPAYIGPYILWSAGPDELFGPNTSSATKTSDDVTNFAPQ